MPKNHNRYRERGAQQQDYSQHGWHNTSRQPQGDFGWGRDHVQLGSGNNDDWRRQQDNTQGALRDSEYRDDWRDSRYYAERSTSSYFNRQRDRDDLRSRAFDNHEQNRSERPSGLDRDYGGAGYAGPGGYGGGYGGQGTVRQRDREQGQDADYSQWRREQMRALDDDYEQWRQERFKKFSDEFSTWRSTRSQKQAIDKEEADSTQDKKKDVT